uniref:Polysaccharide export protein n=1 Tax=Thermodesulfobacterium geofontis TaxID=1295609 RepID=A0A7C4NZ81_9BACT
MRKIKYFRFFSLLMSLLFSIFLNIAFAQNIQIFPLTSYPFIQNQQMQPQQTLSQIQPQSQALSQPIFQTTFIQPQVLQPYQLPEELSDFEQYVSEKIIITEAQLEILKKWDEISFSYTSVPPSGKIAVPVKVIKYIERQGISIPLEIDAGFLIGTPHAITTAFKTLGIKNSIIISTELKQFGYDFFRQPPSTFAPADKVPVSPEYVIGPGDEIRVSLWGSIEGSFTSVVERDGNITLPKVGTIYVAGIPFKELKEILYKEFSKYFKDFDMNVSMGQLKTIKVYVVGHAKAPGAYSVSSLSTLINALFEAGGPSKSGSMRNIQLKRGGKTIVYFDMYEFLLKGDKTKDIRLMPEDVIFIPPAGPLVAIAGSVKVPAIYELKDEKTVGDLIKLAGGLTEIAFKGRVQIERIVENTRQIVFEADLDSALNHELKRGDIVKVFPVFPDKRFVRIYGAIQRPGEYGFKEGMRVRELIMMAGGLKYYAYIEKAELTRVTPTPQGPKTEKIIFSPEKALKGDPEHNIKLQQDDYIFIRAIPEWELYRTVTIAGEVKFPGTYTIKKGETLSSLIERAGGFTEKAYLRGAVFIRQSVKEIQQRQINEMIDRLERELLSISSASIAGALTAEEARILQIETEQKRQFIQRLRQLKALGRMVVKIDEPEKLKGTPFDIELEDGDYIYIPQKPATIQVIGSVFNPGVFIYDKNKTLSDYVELAGDYTQNADKKNVFILKVDGSAVKPHKGLFGLKWNKSLYRWEYNLELEPGDTIVVPEKLIRIAWLREIKNITEIIFHIATTAGVLIAAGL